MSEYYLSKELDANNTRKIHRDDCQLLPATPAFSAELKYLGSYGNQDAAYSKARGLFDLVEFCPDCVGS